MSLLRHLLFHWGSESFVRYRHAGYACVGIKCKHCNRSNYHWDVLVPSK